MEFVEFEEIMKAYSEKIDVEINTSKIEAFYKYMKVLLEWNKNINLTAITEEKEIIIKHFIDSITINKYIKNKKNIFDIGTGAGFPGIPLKIINPKINFTLIDSLNKRINFLEEIKRLLKFENLELVHSRAEDLAHNIEYREKADVVVSRAVSNLSTLVEYMIPFLKKDGICICMKGNNINEEVSNSEKALGILGGKIEKIENFLLPNSEIERNLIIIRKVKNTSNIYPRKAGIPNKKPL